MRYCDCVPDIPRLIHLMHNSPNVFPICLTIVGITKIPNTIFGIDWRCHQRCNCCTVIGHRQPQPRPRKPPTQTRHRPTEDGKVKYTLTSIWYKSDYHFADCNDINDLSKHTTYLQLRSLRKSVNNVD